MIKKICHLSLPFICSLLLIPLDTVAQQENDIWYFGMLGGIDFTSGTAVAINNSVMWSGYEGSASISDQNGNLLFYTNGQTVWNRNHAPMPNGTGLLGAAVSTQSSVIVKKPGANSIYYVFTTDHFAGPNGFRYSEIDMSLDGGLGDLTANKNILLATPTCEKITLVKHQNCADIWVLTHLYGSDTFQSYLLTSAGLATPPVESNVGTVIDAIVAQGSFPTTDVMGQMKASRDGKKLAMANKITGVELFDFDNSTGVVSNAKHIFTPPTQWGGTFGVEFSPSGNVLYATEEIMSPMIPGSLIHQFDLTAGSALAIANSKITVGQTLSGDRTALQLAPNDKIYMAYIEAKTLPVINQPELLGSACGLNLNGIFLNGAWSWMGLPNPTVSIAPTMNLHPSNSVAFGVMQKCFQNMTLFNPNHNSLDSVVWNFGDPSSAANFSDEIQSSHMFSSTGFYEIELTAYENCFYTIDTQLIEIIDIPHLTLGNDTSICMGKPYTLYSNSNATSLLWNTSETTESIVVDYSDIIWVEATNVCGSVIDTIVIDVIDCGCDPYIPNTFTPDGDGINDIFKPEMFCDFSNFKLNIYNRWGELIFQTDNPNLGWDGLSQNNNAQIGVYVYQASYTNWGRTEQVVSGHVNLIR